MLHRPEVLILDEPTSGVDPAARDDFWRLLIELSREQGVTIFLSTHFMNEAQRCDRISLMHAGKVLACDTPAALQQQFAGDTLEAAFVRCLEEAQGTADTPAPAQPEPPAAPTAIAPVRSGLSLARLLAVATREGKELLRDRVRLGFALLGALFMMVIFGYGISWMWRSWPSPSTTRTRPHKAAPTWRPSAAHAISRKNPASATPASCIDGCNARKSSWPWRSPGFGRDLYAGRQPAVAAWLDGGMPFRAETSRNYVEAVHQANLERLAEQSSLPRGPGLQPSWRPAFATTRMWSA